MPESGILYVVATPLGNLGDVSPRAAEILSSADLVAAEDTRRSHTLLSHIGSRSRLISFHSHSPPGRLESILRDLIDGRSVALVSDAGTPTISDPGVELVAAAREAGVTVVTIPGPSAVIAALSVSGLRADRFSFLGFLPRRGKERRKLLEMVAESPWTVAFYEAPPRLEATLADLGEVCGDDRSAVVARELTKAYEEVRAGTLAELRVYYRNQPPRGEITVVVAGRGAEVTPPDPEALRDRGRQLLDEGVTKRDAAAMLASELSVSRNEAYRIINSL
jgi:16S rRNA (cytidine1402-2'-O)-methyltransferase